MCPPISLEKNLDYSYNLSLFGPAPDEAGGMRIKANVQSMLRLSSRE